MARKIEWEIRRKGYGLQGTFTAPTRALALAAAEAKWLADTDYQNDMVGRIMEDGSVYERSPIPEFTAHKVR